MARESLPERALTVWQPSAWAIVAGHKDVENRTGPTLYRGRFAVHAAREGAFNPEILEWMRTTAGIEVPATFDHGMLIGEATLVACWLDLRDDGGYAGPWGSAAAGGGHHAPFKWVLSDAVAYDEPIGPMRGQLGFWRIDKQKGSDDHA